MEELDKQKFDRQHKFYVQLANDEIARVVAGLFRFETEAEVRDDGKLKV